MELYSRVSSRLARVMTEQYSTSFSSASRLFPGDVSVHIYNIYGLVRVADEIVDTYRGTDTADLLDDLEAEIYKAIERGFSTNPIVQAFADTAREYNITRSLIAPFFASMHMDIKPVTYTEAKYSTYIYGSAEVVGLMCLRVFTRKDQAQYDHLQVGAKKLGAAYQKINFLRDLAADQNDLKRFYFPGTTYAQFDDLQKSIVTRDIRGDLSNAIPAIKELPRDVRGAVHMSYTYYEKLLSKLEATPADVIKHKRIRLPAHQKAALFAARLVGVVK